jgi:hypothetical protein
MRPLFSGVLKRLWLISLCFSHMIMSPVVQAADCSSLDTINWLLGDWQQSSDKLIISEHWQQTSPMTFEGLGISERRTEATETAATETVATETAAADAAVSISDKAALSNTPSNTAISTESLRLVAMSDEIFFIAKVASNPLPVAFKLTQCANKIAVFENPHHDFPQTLSYQLIQSSQGDKQLKVKVFAANNPGFEINFSAIETHP